MQDSSKKVVLEVLQKLNFETLLDVPSGDGWLALELGLKADIDGVDLYAESKGPYRKMFQADLNNGIPEELGTYDCIVSCEGLEHLTNPGLFLTTIHNHLSDEGTLLISTPNVWYPGSKLKFFSRGFFPGFPCLTGSINPGSHMHLIPWSFPQLHLFLQLHGFGEISLHAEPLSNPKYFLERLLSLPQKLYCQGKEKKTAHEEEKRFWRQAMSGPSLLGRHLIVSARKQEKEK